MERLAKNKPLFITLSCLSIGCLVGTFAHPLQKLEVWRQVENGTFNQSYERTFIITESDQNYPYGFRQDKAVLVAQIYRDYKFQKLFLLGCAFASALSALSIGSETCINDEIDSEAIQIKARGRKELALEAIKHRLAMASKSQRLLFMDEMKALIEEFGTPEGEILEADELNETDKFVSAGYLLSDGHSIDVVVEQTWGVQTGTDEHTAMKRKFLEWQGDEQEAIAPSDQVTVNEATFREVFPESIDGTTWKAICKAMGDGLTRGNIVKDVLGCEGGQTRLGEYYLDYLKGKYL